MNGAVLSFGGGLWSIPSRLARVNRASTSQKKVPPDKRGNHVNNGGQSDSVSGGRPELQGVIIGNLSREELITMQKNDPNVAIVLDWLTKSPDRPARNLVQDKSPTVRNLWLSWQQLQIVDGLLYKRHDTNSKLTTRLQLVVPEKLQDRVIEANHASIFAGHLGAKKTLSRISRSFFWLNMNEAVRLFIANCVICGARKRPTSKPRAPLGEYNVGHPMDRIAIDIMGPLPVSDNGNKYVMVVGDTFTKWIEAYAIPDQTAETVAEKLVNEFISRFGTPLELHSDQGRTFESNLFQDVCKLLGITKTRTTPYHPSSNGMIERFNLTLANMISSFVDKNQKDWDKNLPLLTAGYRSSTHETIGFSPNFLMLGREVRTPLEFSLDIHPIDEEPSDIGGYANRMAKMMKQSWKLARDNIGRSTSRQKRNYDLRTSVNNYEVGDLVYRLDSTRHKGLSPKLKSARWIGPCVITRKLSELIFEIRSSPRGKTTILHHDRLKPFLSANVPSWARELSQHARNVFTTRNQRQAGTQTNPKDGIELRRSGRRPRPPVRLSL